ncbi:acetate uptake transporter [Anaeromicrobium sediminis]|uniref:Uncharacterized protein n=1 Tax=Anaeromicrobium sediminis TaxID=1478221 RepID=A0A267MDM2_9FIRM|nr:GPR1/FUN34/YaaH family transporter [Anaeromicrobium sediminis]PAB56900.1 hypothetical protein CCE28_20005 [Anaeromicrobium sediminis]
MINETTVKIRTINPSALGQFGLAMVTLVAASQKLGWTSGTSLLIPWAIFLGAFAQLFACIHDAKQNSLFGTTVFGAYALFWFSIGTTWMITNGVFGEAIMAGIDVKQLGMAYIGYFIFSVVMTIAAMEIQKILFIILFLIDFLFLGLAMVAFGIAPHFAHNLAAYSELLISICGFYGFAGNLLNGHFGREILPLGKPLGIIKKS